MKHNSFCKYTVELSGSLSFFFSVSDLTALPLACTFIYINIKTARGRPLCTISQSIRQLGCVYASPTGIPHLPVIKMEWSFGILPADNILQLNVVHLEWLHKNGTKVSPTQTYYFSHKAMHEYPLGTEALHVIEVIPLYI